jgi:hypothetical protein
MATERLSMRQTREILRQKWRLGRTHREVAQSLGISSGAVGTTVLRARAAGLDWAQVDTLSDEALQARVYGPPTPPTHGSVLKSVRAFKCERKSRTAALPRRLGSLYMRVAPRSASSNRPVHRLLWEPHVGAWQPL